MEGNITNNATYTLNFVDGCVYASVDYQTALGTISIEFDLSLIDILKLAASKTDNNIDDKIVALVEKALEKDEK